MTQKKPLEVVAALLSQEGGKYLICQRPAHKDRGLLWEFAGGKVEPGESREEALRRECQEELNIAVAVEEVLVDLTYAYPDLTIHLTLFRTTLKSGTPTRQEHNDLRWATLEECQQYAFCPADAILLQKLWERQEKGGI